MSAQIISGKELSAKIRAELKQEVEQLKKQGITPGLAVMVAGDDPASHIYVNNKEKACQEIGIYSEVRRLPGDITQQELMSYVKEYNERKDINGLLVQLPLPKHLDEEEVLKAISPDKDVDGFHVINAGSLFTGLPGVCGVYAQRDYQADSIDGCGHRGKERGGDRAVEYRWEARCHAALKPKRDGDDLPL